jgi:hypothetical protein
MRFKTNDIPSANDSNALPAFLFELYRLALALAFHPSDNAGANAWQGFLRTNHD